MRDAVKRSACAAASALVVLVPVVVFASAAPAKVVAPGTVTNPTLPPKCGIKVALVVDSSGSIGNDAGQVTGAVGSFLDALIGTGSQVGLVDFDTQVNQTIPYTPVNATTRAGIFQTYLNSYSVGGGTNWAAALRSTALLQAGGTRPDLVLFITDGRPTYRGGYTTPGGTFIPLTDDGNGSETSAQERIEAANRADELKLAGSHIFLTGVGTALGTNPPAGDIQSIQSVTGDQRFPTVTSSFSNADYSLIPQFAQLAAALRSLVFSLCDTSVTVTKLVSTDNGATAQPADDVPITGTISAVTGSSTVQWQQPATGVVGVPSAQIVPTANGGISTFKWAPGSLANPGTGSTTFALTEPGAANLAFLRATCTTRTLDTTGTPTPTPYNLGDPITVPRGAIVACTITNAKLATLTIRKQWSGSVAGDTARMTVTGGPNGPQSATSTGTGSGFLDTTNVITLTVPVGTVLNISELVTYATTQYAMSLGCNGVTQSLTFSGGGPPPGTRTASTNFVVPDVGTFQCTFVNGLQPVFVLTKTWGPGSRPTDAVALNATAGGRTAPPGSSVAGGSTFGAILPVNPGETVSMSESFTSGAAADYTTSLTCTGNHGTLVYTPGALTATIPITDADVGGVVQCTFNNDGPFARVVVRKTLVPSLDPGRFDLQINGTTVVSNATDGSSSLPVEVRVGDDVTVGETGTTDTPLDRYDTSTACDGGVTPDGAGAFVVPQSALGGTITCTITNVRKAATILVNKAWVGPLDPTHEVVVGVTTGSGGIASIRSFNNGETQPPAQLDIPVGTTARLGERFDVGSVDDYHVGLACDGVAIPLQKPTVGVDADAPISIALLGNTEIETDVGGNLDVPVGAAGTQISCIFTNTRTQLRIDKTVTTQPVRNPDGTVTIEYGIAVTNTGTVASNYALTDEFRFAKGVVVKQVTASNVEPGDIPVNPNFNGAGVASLASAAIAAGATHRFGIAVTTDISAVHTASAFDCTIQNGEAGTGFLNEASVTDAATRIAETDDACAPIPKAADVVVVKRVDSSATIFDPTTALFHQTYTIDVTNRGPAPAEAVTLVDQLPPGATILSFTTSSPSCAAAQTALRCTFGTLANGATVHVVLVVSIVATPGTSVSNRAEVSSTTPDPDPSNNVDEVISVLGSSAVVPPPPAVGPSELSGTLPLTGAGSLAMIAMATTLVGLALVVPTRRRRRARRP